MTRGPISLDYVPSERQLLAHTTYVDELFYGGAAGGGKSEFARQELIRACLEVPGFRALLIRRSFPELRRSMIPALRATIPKQLATYNKTEHEFTFVNGSVLEVGHMLTEDDWERYQGVEYQLIVIDELTHFTKREYKMLRTRLRAAGALRERMLAKGMRPRMIATGNPGGIGHAWVKSYFIDPAPAETPFTIVDPDDPDEQQVAPAVRCFIPAKAADNPHLGPEYRQVLRDLDSDTRRALLEGDWNAYKGQRFTDWRSDVHVITPEQAAAIMPAVGGVRVVGVDYGLDAPFAALWMWLGPDGLVVVYRELYATGLTPKQQAAMIQKSEAPGEREGGRRIPVVLDPATWARNAHAAQRAHAANVPPPGSIADTYYRAFGSQLVKAQNDRLAGVALVADLLRVRPDGQPRLLVVDTCRALIRTLPFLPRDPKRPEDVDTKSEDHSYDGLRYGLMEIIGRRPDRDHRGTTEQRGSDFIVPAGPAMRF